jgi:hypothetical protein
MSTAKAVLHRNVIFLTPEGDKTVTSGAEVGLSNINVSEGPLSFRDA